MYSPFIHAPLISKFTWLIIVVKVKGAAHCPAFGVKR